MDGSLYLRSRVGLEDSNQKVGIIFFKRCFDVKSDPLRSIWFRLTDDDLFRSNIMEAQTDSTYVLTYL